MNAVVEALGERQTERRRDRQPGLLHPAADARHAARWGCALIAIAFAGFGAWAALAPIAGAVIAPAVVKVEANRKTVQHLEGGIVKEILVKEGERVKKHQPLIVLGDERVAAEFELTQRQLDQETARAARLRAELDGVERIDFPPLLRQRAQQSAIAQLIRTEESIFAARRGALAEQLEFLHAEAGETQREIRELSAQQGAQQAGGALLQEELAANERLHELQFISKMQVLRLKRGMQDYAARSSELSAAIAKARQKLVDLQRRGAALRGEQQRSASAETAQARAKILELQERLRPSQDAAARQVITAPIAGTIVDLKVFTAGGVIKAGEALADIVPDESPLIVEARVHVDDIEHVSVGMDADVRLTAYQARNTPLASGRVTYVSADRMVDEITRAPYYIAYIGLERSARRAQPLQPGMQAEVFLRTGARTALDYLLEPVTASLGHAMREP